MSAIPIIAPRPAPSPASSATPPVDQHADSATFDAHLQDVQQMQPQASSASDNNPSSVQPPPAKAAGVSANGKADQTAGDDGVDADADSSVSTAAQVLGLIQQSSGDTAAAATTSADGKPTGKTSSRGDEVKPAQPAATGMPMPPSMPLPSPMPLSVSSSQTASSSTDGDTTTSAASPSTAVAASAQQMPGKTSGAFSTTDDAGKASAADAGDDDSDSVTASASSTDASTQASFNTLFGNAHSMLAAAVDATTPAAAQAQDAGDLATLRGALAAPVLTTSTNNSAAPHNLTISANVTSPHFSQELGQQVSWLGGQEIKQAQIRLNPQDLGPLDVKVSVVHGRVDVVFAAQHPTTVAAVQQSLQQLNQMLGGQGLSLGQATVGQHTAQQQFGHAQGQASSASAQTTDVEPTDSAVSPLSAPLAIGLVDAFA